MLCFSSRDDATFPFVVEQNFIMEVKNRFASDDFMFKLVRGAWISKKKFARVRVTVVVTFITCDDESLDERKKLWKMLNDMLE